MKNDTKSNKPHFITITPFLTGIIATIIVLIFFPGSFILIAPILLAATLAISGIWYWHAIRSAENHEKLPAKDDVNSLSEIQKELFALIKGDIVSIQTNIENLPGFEETKKWFEQQNDQKKTQEIFDKFIEDKLSKNISFEAKMIWLNQVAYITNIFPCKIGLTALFSEGQKNTLNNASPSERAEFTLEVYKGLKPFAEEIIKAVNDKRSQLSSEVEQVSHSTIKSQSTPNIDSTNGISI